MVKADEYTVLVVGATSSIAKSYIRLIIENCNKDSKKLKLILFARNQERLHHDAKDYQARGAFVAYESLDLLDVKSTSKLKKYKNINQALIFHGSLTDNDLVHDLLYLEEQLRINFSSYVIWSEFLVKIFLNQKNGHLVLIGSVAGDRGRSSNYIYGAAKSGIETYFNGLDHRLNNEKNINILLVKPGLIDSRMTKDFNKNFLWSSPDKVAQNIYNGIKKKKRIIYTPSYWIIIMLIIKAIPRFIFNKTDF